MTAVRPFARPRISTAVTLTGAQAYRWLSDSSQGRVAAVYRHCLYLADHRDELICLGSRRLEPGPINALCDTDWERLGSFNIGDAWQRHGEAFHVGVNNCFRIDNPTVWRPAPTRGPGNTDAIADNLHRAYDYLSTIDAGPLMPLVLMRAAPRPSRLQTAFQQQATSGIHALLHWLDDSLTHSRSAGEIPESVVSLIGLGPGLTPSGDDFLGGALVALRTLKLDTAAARLSVWIKRHAPPLTTNISLAHLSAACDGEALEPVHRALNAVLESDSDDGIEAALAGLSAVGHSSGWDAFSGVLAVTEAWQRNRCAAPHRDCA